MNSSQSSPDQLAAALLMGVDQDNPAHAAIRLLAAHGKWLRTPAFIRAVGPMRASTRGGGWALLDWDSVAVLAAASPASSSERAILRLACSLAGALPDVLDDPRSWTLRAMLAPLDGERRDLAVAAITAASGIG